MFFLSYLIFILLACIKTPAASAEDLRGTRTAPEIERRPPLRHNHVAKLSMKRTIDSAKAWWTAMRKKGK